MVNIDSMYSEAVELLRQLIQISSFSEEEDGVAKLMVQYLHSKGLNPNRKGNNVWVSSKNWNVNKPVVMLNSHLDTIRPVKGWISDPFNPLILQGKLYGLGSNDAGASLVSLLMAYQYLITLDNLPYNLIFSATAEEEIAGIHGIRSIMEEISPVDLVVIGEPTSMKMAIAERGLIVIDCIVKGKAAHAARNEGVNAIYKAIKTIEWFQNYQFPKVSDLLGPVKMTVTQIEAGNQHNVIPDVCKFVVDVQTNEKYTNHEVFDLIKKNVDCDIKPRSFRMKPSSIPIEHPIVQKGISIGLEYFGSPTSSDQAILKELSIKIGPGDSARSHISDEFVYLDEIKQGISTYIELLKDLSL